MHSQLTFIPKQFMITSESNGTAVKCNLNVIYKPKTRQINLSRALSEIHSQSVNLSNSQIFYLDFQKGMYIFVGQFPFTQDIFLKYELFLGSSIEIKYRSLNTENKISEKSNPVLQKKKKVKQRTIREAVQAVKQWRQLYEVTDVKGKRLYTLESAAQKIGYAKKTLDDYFNQLRLAQQYNFDFNLYYSDKIGLLRKFVKNYQKSSQSKSKMISQDDEKFESLTSHGINNDDIDRYFLENDSSDEQNLKN